MATVANANIDTTVPQIDYYKVLGIEPHASPADIKVAYERQRALYDPTHGAQMGDDFAADAVERRAAIEQAYATLSDPKRRFAYDEVRGLVGTEATDRRGVSNREVMWTIGGVLVGLLLLSLVYNLTSGSTRQSDFNGRFSTVPPYAAPPINLKTLDGGTFNLADHRGKVVIVNFWGTWCEPCKRETPALQAAYQKLHAQGLEIVGVDLFDQEQAQYSGDITKVRAFTERFGVTYPIALDATGDVVQAYKLYPIPVSYIVDPQGNVRYIRISELTTADIEQVFEKLKNG